MEPARIIVTGDRHWRCPAVALSVVERLRARYGPALVIVHGAADGVDRSFAAACDDLGVNQEPHPADWDRLGRRAGPIRNGEMVRAGALFALAVHRYLKGSKGTLDCVRQCLAAGIPVWQIKDDRAVPSRIRDLAVLL